MHECKAHSRKTFYNGYIAVKNRKQRQNRKKEKTKIEIPSFVVNTAFSILTLPEKGSGLAWLGPWFGLGWQRQYIYDRLCIQDLQKGMKM